MTAEGLGRRAAEMIDPLVAAIPLDAAGLAWGPALESGDFDSAVSEIERVLGESGETSEAKLWWIQAQLRLGAVPSSALTSSLEDSLSDPALAGSALALRCALQLMRDLVMKGQLRLSLSLLDRILALDASSSVPRLKPDLAALGVAVIDEELRRSEGRREARASSESLKTKRAELSKKASENPPVIPLTEPKRAPTAFSSKDIFSSVNPQPEPFVLGEPPPAPPGAQPARARGRGLVVALLLLLVCGIGVGLFRLIGQLRIPADLDQRLAMSFVMAAPRPIVMPMADSMGELSRKAGRDDRSLDDLARRLDRVSSASSTAPGDTANEGSSKPEALPPPERPASYSGAGSSVPDVTRDTTQDPPGPGRGRGPDRPLPEPHGSSRPDIRLGADGREYGPAPDNRTFTDPASRALDGGPLREYEVEQFVQPMPYRILAGTDVLSRPSVFAARIARLEVNDEVEAISKMGGWLELRPRKGVRGYIFAQDAVPAER